MQRNTVARRLRALEAAAERAAEGLGNDGELCLIVQSEAEITPAHLAKSVRLSTPIIIMGYWPGGE